MSFLGFILFSLANCVSTETNTGKAIQDSRKASPFEIVYKKAHSLSQQQLEKRLSSSAHARRLEVMAASGEKTANFKYMGYTDTEISAVRKLIRENKQKIEKYRTQNKTVVKSWPSPTESMVFVAHTITVPPDETFDGKNKIYVWVGEGDCSQKEGMDAMFRLGKRSHIKNLFMIYAPDGIHFHGSNASANKIVNLDVCEDAMTGKYREDPEIKNITVKNSVFFDCADKGLQFSRIRAGISVIGNKFIRCSQPIRINKFLNGYTAKNNLIIGASDWYNLMSFNTYW